MKWKRKWEMGNGKENQLFQRIEPHKRCLDAQCVRVCDMNPLPPFPFPLPCLPSTLATPRQARCLPPSAIGRARKQNATLHFMQPQQQKPAATNCGMQHCMCVCVCECVLPVGNTFPFSIERNAREGEPKPDPGPVRLASEPELEPQPKPWPFPPLHAHSPPPLSERAQMEPEVEHTAADAVKQKQVAAGPH